MTIGIARIGDGPNLMGRPSKENLLLEAWQMMLPKLFGGRRKKDRRPTDLKIPVPRLHGIHNADLTESQIAAILSKPHQLVPSQFNKDHFAHTYNHRIVTHGEPFRESRDITGPSLYMPKPGHPLPLARRLLQGEDHDKTQIESEHEADVESVSCGSKYDDDDADLFVKSLEVKPNNVKKNHGNAAETSLMPLNSDAKAPLAATKESLAVSANPKRDSPPTDFESIDFRTTPTIPGHYPKSSSLDKPPPLERASYMSEMSSNESQQTFETAPQSPFSRLSSVRSTPSMSVLASIDIPDTLDPSNVLYYMSLQRHSAPEAHHSESNSEVIESQTLKSLKPVVNATDRYNQHHQIESFPALLSPDARFSQSPQSPHSSKGKSTGIPSSSMTSPASSVTTTKAMSSAVTTPGQGSIKRFNSMNSQTANNSTTVKTEEMPRQNSIKQAESSTESNATATPGSRRTETSAEIEALRLQMVAIQQERQEWKIRENEHRAREREMLEQISRTQEQLQLALAQAGFFTGTRAKNPTPISQSSSGVANAEFDTTSSGSLKMSRKQSSGSRNHSHSRSHHSRSRSNSRGRTMPYTDRYQYERDRRKHHQPQREHSRSRSYDRGGVRRYDHRGYMMSSSGDSNDEYQDWRSRSRQRRRSSRESYNRRAHHGDYSSDSDFEHRGRRRRYARSLDPPSRTISRSRSGSISRTPHAYHSAVEDEEQARTRPSADHPHRREIHRAQSRTRPDDRPSRSDARLHSQKPPPPNVESHFTPAQGTTKPSVPNGKTEPSPIVTPKSILRNGGILSRQSSAGSTIRKMNNGRSKKDNK